MYGYLNDIEIGQDYAYLTITDNKFMLKLYAGNIFISNKRKNFLYLYNKFFLIYNRHFFKVAMTSSIPNIVSDKKISNINSMSQSTNSISSILAPIVGGLVFAVLNINFFGY